MPYAIEKVKWTQPRFPPAPEVAGEHLGSSLVMLAPVLARGKSLQLAREGIVRRSRAIQVAGFLLYSEGRLVA